MRQPPPSLSDRLQRYIIKKIYPDSLAVRGNWVAVDYVTDALLRHGTMSRYELFVEPAYVEPARALLGLNGNGNGDGSGIDKNHAAERRFNVASMLDLATGADKYSFTAFLNPAGGFPQPLAIRNHFASKLYPITFLSHGFSLHSMLYDGFLRLLLEGTYPCDSVICTSRASRAAMANILAMVAERFDREFHAHIEYSGRLDVVPLCVDTEKFKPQDKRWLRGQLGLPKDALILLYFGYISALKAELMPLVQVFRQIVKDNCARPLLLLIAGTKDMEYADALQRCVADLSLTNQVRLMDGPSEETKSALTAAADVFVSPGDSIQESFGLTPIEAMACGIPQVVADWDGYRDTVSHGETGFLVPTYWTRCDADLTDTGQVAGWDFDHLALGQSVAVDVDSLRWHLQLLIENDLLREEMSHRSRTRAETLYSFPAVVKRYEDLWFELSEMARGQARRPTGVNFDRPQYFDCFRSHASCVVEDDCSISLTSLGREASHSDLGRLLHPKLAAYRTIDPDLVRRALDELKRWATVHSANPQSANGATFGGIVAALTTDHARHHPDYIRRNVMWLIKNGLVKAVF